MTNGKPRDARKEQQWRRWIADWRRSGLSVSAFCTRYGLGQASFYAWRRTLARRDSAAAQFVPVHVIPDEPAGHDADHDGSGLELVVGAGRRLRIGRDFDAPTLQRLLALLEEGRP